MLIPNVPFTKFDIQYNPNTQTIKPIFGTALQKLGRGSDYHTVSIDTASLYLSDAQRISSVLKLGTTDVVRVNIPVGDMITTGFGNVAAQSGSGRTLVLKGVTAGKTFKSGQWVNVEYNKSGTIIGYLHQITADATAASNGVVTVSIKPSLKRTSNLANSRVEVAQPYLEGLIADDTQTMSMSSHKLSTAKFSFNIGERE
jgi:hypothetical protein